MIVFCANIPHKRTLAMCEMVPTVLTGGTQVHVASVNDPAWATFCESYESAHSQQDLTAAIARVGGGWGVGQEIMRS